jgi:hypothetical protein
MALEFGEKREEICKNWIVVGPYSERCPQI